MRILVELLHPAAVHVFKNAVRQWLDRRDEVIIVVGHHPEVLQLLEVEGLSAGKRRGASPKVEHHRQVFTAARRTKPDILTGIMAVRSVAAGRLLGLPSVIFYDAQQENRATKVACAFADSVCVPEAYAGPVYGRRVNYPSYLERAYLHPPYFSADPSALLPFGIDLQRPYFILQAMTSTDLMQRLVTLLQPHGRVLILNEGKLPEPLNALCVHCAPQAMHQLIAQAQLFIGENATTASEAAVLGIPAVCAADCGRGYTHELEAVYGLLKHFPRKQTPALLQHVAELLAMPDRVQVFAERKRCMQLEKMDTTEWMMDYIDSVVAGHGPTGTATPLRVAPNPSPAA